MVTRLAEGSGSGVATCRSPGLRGRSGGGAMLRLAAKLMAFFWRRADGPKEMTGLQELELLEGASWGGAGAWWGPGGRAGRGMLVAPSGTGNCTSAPEIPPVCELHSGQWFSVLHGRDRGKPSARCTRTC